MFEVKTLGSGSRGNCHILTPGGGSPLLLDAGLPIKKIREGLSFGLSCLSGALITHEHKDHCLAVKDLIRASVDVYATPGTIEALNLESHRLHPIKFHKWFRVGEWRIRAFPVVHDAADACGYVIAIEDERILYLTDTAYSPYTFKGLTRIMLEANYDPDILKKNVEQGLVDKAVMHRVIRNHMSIQRAMEFLRANDLDNVKEIVVIHASDDNSNVERFKEEIAKLTGKVIRIA